MRNYSSLLLLGSSLAFTACSATSTAGGSATDDTAESAIDNSDSTSDEGNMMMATADGSDMTSFTQVSVSAQVSANLGARFTPSSCAVITPGASTIKAVFNDCTGIHGLVHVSGELDLAVAVSRCRARSRCTAPRPAT